MNLGRVCAHESAHVCSSFWSTDSLVLFSFVIKRRYVECRYETSFVIRQKVLPGMVGKYHGEKK